jgi:hypothetical protein
MYVYDSSYNSLKTFLVGYLLAYSSIYELNLIVEFKKWLEKDQNKVFALDSFTYIQTEIANCNDDYAAEVLLDMLFRFFESIFPATAESSNV